MCSLGDLRVRLREKGLPTAAALETLTREACVLDSPPQPVDDAPARAAVNAAAEHAPFRLPCLLPFLAELWHAPLRRLLARKGFRVVGEFACRGFDTWGPLWLTGGLNRAHPDDRDLARAEKFAAGLAVTERPAASLGSRTALSHPRAS